MKVTVLDDYQRAFKLTAANQNRFNFQAVFVEKPHFSSDPNVALPKAERWVTDLDPFK